MNVRETVLSAALLVALLASGCAHRVPATTRMRQDDGTYKISRGMVVMPSLNDLLSFVCKKDYDVVTMMCGVEYAWPKGRGSIVDHERIIFEGKDLRCEVNKRTLTANGKTFGDFTPGDSVRVSFDGRVFVNDLERSHVAK